MVTTFYPPHHFGGDGMFVYRLAHALGERGHRVDVIHSVDAYHLQHPDAPEVAFAEHPNVRRFPLETRRAGLSALLAHQLGTPGFYARRLREIFAQNSYDVIHYHNVSLMGAPAVLRMGRGVKLYTTHEYWLVCPTHVLFKMDREACATRECLKCTLHSKRPPQTWRWGGMLGKCLEEIDCILTPSQFALERHREAGIERPMVRLPHFVPEIAGTEASATPRRQGERGYFLYVGRLEKLKGVQDLLAIFSQYRHADLKIVGAGAHGETLKAAARDLPHVQFVGKVHPSALAEMYQGAIGVLVPSLCYETFGLTAAEALMNGTPAIVRRIGALTEIIAQTGGGFAFGDERECIEAMETLRTNPALRREMGERGRAAARELWSVREHLSRYLSIVEDAMTKKERAGVEKEGRKEGKKTRMHNEECKMQNAK